MVATVPERLRDAARLFEERNAAYGNNYKLFGRVMHAMYPDGLTVQNEDQWTRLILQVHRVTKETRYSANFLRGGHSDSMRDQAVYAIMADETDEESCARANEAWAQAMFGENVYDRPPETMPDPETPPDVQPPAPPVTSMIPSVGPEGEVVMLAPEVQRELSDMLEKMDAEESFVPRGRTQGVSLDEYRAQNPWADVPRTPLAKDPNERMIPRNLDEPGA